MKAAIICLILVLATQKCFSATDKSYTAAVIEYYPVQNSSLTPEERTLENANRYIHLLKEAGQNIDIAIFPEATITTGSSHGGRSGLLNVSPVISKVDGTVIPCDEEDNFPEYFVKLSCAARELSTYLVANIIEQSVCSQDVLSDISECASDDRNMYNTNVAFDRNGGVVARYRKFHLFGEYQMNITKDVEITTFTADFGITFGTFICFDTLFEEPPLQLVRDNVKHLIFPSMWFSETPFLTSLQTQNMWAVANDAILLAAGANNPGVGSGGTGIYQGVNGPQTMGILGLGGSKIYIQEVPKVWDHKRSKKSANEDIATIDQIGSDMDNFYLKVDKITGYNSYLIDDNISETYCYENFCCKFTVEFTKSSTSSDNYYRYRAFVYSGVRSFDGVYNGGIEVCAVVFCPDVTVESCGKRILPYGDIEWATTFTNIAITGTYDAVHYKQQYPNTLLSSVRPIEAENYEWSSSPIGDGALIERTIRLVERQSRLLTFGIYGRDFNRDSAPAANEMDPKRIDL